MLAHLQGTPVGDLGRAEAEGARIALQCCRTREFYGLFALHDCNQFCLTLQSFVSEARLQLRSCPYVLISSLH